MTAAMLRQFHHFFGGEGTRTDDPELRPKLHDEEHDELLEAFVSGDREQIARELADVVYVAYGSAFVYGIDLDVAVGEVHRANMRKLTDGRAARREDGKVLKPVEWREPDMRGAV